jgi:isoquinoline 1-oxidoreductase
MSADLDLDLEPERYELFEPGRWLPPIDRRAFFRIVGGGLVVLSLLREAPAQQESGRAQRRGRGQPVPREIGAWLHIAEDGSVTAYTGKVEVGQNIRTSLAQAVADELHLPVDSVGLVMGDTSRVPFDMGTFGSRTTPAMSAQLRRAAAAARERLAALAAEKLGVDRSRIDVADGKVSDRESGRSVGLGELTQGKKLLDVIDEGTETTPPDRWQAAGRSVPKAGGSAFVTGRHQFASDIKRPGQLVGKVLRPPSYGATLASLDTSAAKAIPGVTVVHDGEFVGVAAPDEKTAARALAAIRAEWKIEPAPCSDRDLYDYLKNHLEEGRAGRGDEGDVSKALASSDVKLERTFHVAYIAHAPLEPRSAVAEWEGDQLTVWTGTQRPFGVRGELAQALSIPEDRVRVIVPDTGAGYGGKHTGDAAVEAARLARAAGRPVRRVWTREEEFTWAYFRPAGVIEASAGASRDGTLSAWSFLNINSGGSGVESPYKVDSRREGSRPARSPLRQGSYRALASTANHFAREGLMDELARELGLDPLAFRRKNLEDARLRAVFEAAAERFGWGSGVAEGRGVGIAGGTEKGGFVATCAEVEASREGGAVRVVRLVTAFECGAIVNPDHLRNQVEGAVVQGLGGALFEAIRFEGGKLRNARFSRYRVPRFSDLPAIEVVLLDRKDLPPAGAGEAPIIAVAPAIAAAIFDATGVRLRSLPMVPEGLKS